MFDECLQKKRENYYEESNINSSMMKRVHAPNKQPSTHTPESALRALFQNKRECLRAGKKATVLSPFLLTSVFSTFFADVLFQVWHCYDVALYIRFHVHSISILHLVIVQTNADTWFQPSSFRSIIEIELSGLSLLLRSLPQTKTSFPFHATTPHIRVCHGLSSHPT